MPFWGVACPEPNPIQDGAQEGRFTVFHIIWDLLPRNENWPWLWKMNRGWTQGGVVKEHSKQRGQHVHFPKTIANIKYLSYDTCINLSPWCSELAIYLKKMRMAFDLFMENKSTLVQSFEPSHASCFNELARSATNDHVKATIDTLELPAATNGPHQHLWSFFPYPPVICIQNVINSSWHLPLF